MQLQDCNPGAEDEILVLSQFHFESGDANGPVRGQDKVSKLPT